MLTASINDEEEEYLSLCTSAYVVSMFNREYEWTSKKILHIPTVLCVLFFYSFFFSRCYRNSNSSMGCWSSPTILHLTHKIYIATIHSMLVG